MLFAVSFWFISKDHCDVFEMGLFFGCGLVSILLLLLISGAFGLAIFYDLTGTIPSLTFEPMLSFCLLSGFAYLGLLSVTYFFVSSSKRGSRAVVPRILGWILTAVGLLASILGIVSFYLDYLR